MSTDAIISKTINNISSQVVETEIVKSREVINLTLNGFQVNQATEGQYGSKEYDATVDVDWNNGNVQFVQLTAGNNTITFSNPLGTGRYILILIQPESGDEATVTFPVNIRWCSGNTPQLSTGSSKEDLITLIYRSADDTYRGNYSLNY